MYRSMRTLDMLQHVHERFIPVHTLGTSLSLSLSLSLSHTHTHTHTHVHTRTRPGEVLGLLRDATIYLASSYYNTPDYSKKALLRLYEGSFAALFRLYEGSFKDPLRLH